MADQLPSQPLILWIWVLGAYALLGAVCVAEPRRPCREQGLVRLRRRSVWASGRVLGRLERLDRPLHRPGLGVTTLGDYLAPLLPIGSAWVAVGILVLFTLIQWPGVRLGAPAKSS